MPRELAVGEIDFADLVRPGDLVLWGQSAAEPVPLTRRLMEQRHRIGRFGVFLGMSHQGAADPACADGVDFTAYCGTGDNRRLAAAGCLDLLPSHYSDMAAALPGHVDVLLVQVAPGAGGDGYSLGLAHEYLVPLVKRARLVVAEVNERCPWTFGDGILGEDDIGILVRTARPPVEVASPPPAAGELAVARRVAGLIGDGATLQLGIGGLPRAILPLLRDRRDLGIHSGVIGDEVVDLIEAGAVTNARKGIDRGVTVAGLLSGSERLYRFAHRNPALSMRATAYTHSRAVLERIERFTAVNAAIEVDLTGQVNAETARGIHVGAVGGATDFLRGAHASKGGLPIVALPSTAGRADRCVSRIVARLSGPVSTARSDAGIVVTEHGVADLRGLSLARRIERMIAIADPAFREALERDSREGFLLR